MNETAREVAYADIAIGDAASFLVTIDAALVHGFAKLSGDTNPLHMDPAYAASTPFKQPIAHGMIAGALFSRLVGMHLPGKYSLYLSQTLRFHEPVEIGAVVRVRGEVIHKTEAHQTVTLRTVLEDEASKKVLVSGEAMVKVIK